MCKSGQSGIKTLWVGAFDDANDVIPKYPDRVYDVLDSTGQPLKFYKFPLPIDIGNFEENVTADATLGTSFVEITINGTVLGLDHDDAVELSKMAKAKQLIVAELYNTEINGKPQYILLGEVNGLDMTGGGSRSGDAAASLQGYEVTWTGKELNYARHAELDDIVVDDTGEYLTFGMTGPSNVVGAYDVGTTTLSVSFDDVPTADSYEVRYSIDGEAYQYETGTTSPIDIVIAQTSEDQVVKYGVNYTITATSTVSGYTPGEDVTIPST